MVKLMDQEKVSRVENPQQGITITYASTSEPTPMERMTSEAFDILGICLALLPFLYLVLILVRDNSERNETDRIIRQGEEEANQQSELRRKRREAP